MTMNDNWGYAAGDLTSRAARELLHQLVVCASRGNNYLLNMGPDGDGLMPQAGVERLLEIGAWLKVHGEAIYGSERLLPAWWNYASRGQVTTKGDCAYLVIENWLPDGEAIIQSLKNEVRAATLMATGQPVQVRRSGRRIILSGLPEYPPAMPFNVVKLELDGPAEVQYFYRSRRGQLVITHARKTRCPGRRNSRPVCWPNTGCRRSRWFSCRWAPTSTRRSIGRHSRTAGGTLSKLRRGAFDPTAVEVPRFLPRPGDRAGHPATDDAQRTALGGAGRRRRAGHAATSTMTVGDDLGDLSRYKLIVYPFIEGRDAYEVVLSEHSGPSSARRSRRFTQRWSRQN